MQKTVASICLVLITLPGFAQTPELVKDINQDIDPTSLVYDLLGSFQQLNGTTMLFWADDRIHGVELWKTDGTEAGTVLVKDISPGRYGSRTNAQITNSFFDQGKQMALLNGFAYFFANDGVNGEQLWKTDGTTAGTTRVVDISGTLRSPRYLTTVGSVIYFSGFTPSDGSELWRSDGTAAGTYMVKSINASGNSSPIGLVNVNGTLFFFANDNTNGRELWRSDGSAAGTTLVKDLTVGSESTILKESIAINGLLYFTKEEYYAPDPLLHDTYVYLWRSDGTAAGTTRVVDNTIFEARHLRNLNNTLVFSGFDGKAASASYPVSHGWQLWRSDGTNAGTSLLKSSFTFNGSGQAYSADNKELTVVNNQLYAVENGFTAGFLSELWKTDGTTGGTMRVKKIPDNLSALSKLSNVNGTLLFAYSRELWRSDGSEAGTTLVKNVRISPNPSNFLGVGNTLLFGSSDAGDNGRINLWKSDGTAAGTLLVKKVDQSTEPANPRYLTDINGTLFFSANALYGTVENSVQGLWRSDGTTAGTTLIMQGTANNLTNVNGTLFLSRENSSGNNSLWKSNGTAAGTEEVKDLYVVHQNSTSTTDIRYAVQFNGALFFIARETYWNSQIGFELWKSDGTTAGTVLVKDVYAGPNDAFSGADPNFFVFNGALYFVANDGINGREIWKTDGTAAGTVMLKNITTGIQSSIPNDGNVHFTVLNNTLYFLAFPDSGRVLLWKTDGTTAGTLPVTSDSYTFENVVNVNSTLFLTEKNNGTLWKSDGTVAGTILVKNGFNRPSKHLTNVGGQLFFFGSESATGRELWKSDGTATGTTLVKDINPGIDSSVPDDGFSGYGDPAPIAFNDQLYFTATTPTAGIELWRSDGTTAGTQMMELFELDNDSAPRNFFVSNNKLFFSAESVKKRELWKVTAPCTQLVSQRTGNWNDPTVWTCNRIPAVGDVVTVAPGHIVSIGAGVVGICKTLKQQGRLLFGAGGRLRLE